MKRLLLINEFAPSDGAPTGWNMGLLIEGLKNAGEHCEFEVVSGFIKRYRPGGLSALRLLNMAYMYLKTPLAIMRCRPTHILVMTSPACIQIWTALFAGGIKKDCLLLWAMDLHPEIEARFFQQVPFLSFFAGLLRKIDAWALSRFGVIIALDEAMKELITQKAPSADVLVYPTMIICNNGAVQAGGSDLKEPVSLVYAGNYGKAHEINMLEKVLSEIAQVKKIKLVTVGVNQTGEKIFNDLSLRHGIVHERIERKPPQELLSIISKCDYGIVLMKERFRGTVSPSKFLDYIYGGIPLLYCGPEKTNADDACRRLGAGVAFEPEDENIRSKVHQLLNPDSYQGFQKGVMTAAQYYKNKDGGVLAREILKRWI